MATKTTAELCPGDRVRLVGRHVRTVDRVVDLGHVNRNDLPIFGVMYREGTTAEWSGGNSGIASTTWELYESRAGDPCPACEGQLGACDACAVCAGAGVLA